MVKIKNFHYKMTKNIRLIWNMGIYWLEHYLFMTISGIFHMPQNL